MALVGYELERTAAAPGESFNISLTWRVLKRAQTDYAATVQVMDDRGTKIGQSDVLLSTSTWTPGITVSDQRRIQIAPDAAVGVYQIRVAVYEPTTVQNLTLYRDRQVLAGGGLLNLWTLRVPPK